MMKISQKGIDLIKEFEGYGRKLPNGDCTAYQEMINGKLDIPTIGYGCTRGVKMGMVWTQQQAEDALKTEIEGHEKRVNQYVTVDLNQYQFDALVSFDYNTGGIILAGGRPSNVLTAVNKKDWAGVHAALGQWVMFGGRKSVGLIRRRNAEIALFSTPVKPVETDFMPQEPEQAKAPVKKSTIATVSALLSGAATTVAQTGIPAPPPQVTNTVAQVGAWKGLLKSVGADPLILFAVLGVGLIFGLPYLIDKIRGKA